MPQVNGHARATMTVTETDYHQISGQNRQTYHRLKQALKLGLRRQIFIAVCDDLALRNRLAAQLHTQLTAPERSNWQEEGRANIAYLPSSGNSKVVQSASFNSYPRLVSLKLNLSDPNPIAQLSRWLAQHPPLNNNAPAFQFLGVERLTKQPATVQGLFLRSLQGIKRSLPRLDSALLLWVPRPWFRTIQQSAPEFWQWHTAVFEFEGEPRPLPAEGQEKVASFPPRPKSLSPRQEQHTDFYQNPEESAAKADQSEFERPHDTHDAWTAQLTGVGGQGSDSSDLGSSLSPLESAQGNEVNPWLNEALQNLLPLQALEEIEQLQQQNSPPEALVEAYLKLGNYYRDRLEQSDVSQENLTIAIQAYEHALAWLEEDSPLAPDILNDLGNLYWMLSRFPATAEQMLTYLEQGINMYQLALTKLNPETGVHTYAMIQNNLGAAYGDLARYRDTPENLQQSIHAYKEALRYRLPEDEPLKYAATQNNLGTAYWHLAQLKQPVLHLQQAIAAYSLAVEHYDPQTQALNWAMLQNNMGTAYWNLAQYQQPETHLQLAVEAYQKALRYRTAEVVPAACAATQNNLGTAYWHLAALYQAEPETRAEYLQICIAAYEVALSLAHQLKNSTPAVPVTFDVWATHNNLGLAHYQLATEGKTGGSRPPQGDLQMEHLEAALHHHLQALQGFSNQPENYQSAFSYVVQTIRAFYRERGLQGQNFALSKVPGQLLPELLPRL